MENQLKQFVAYYRVSSKRQKDEGVSLEAQKKIVTEYALRNGFQIIKVFEIDESAKRSNRTAFQQMISSVRDDRNISGIICEKVDRLLRGNLKDRVVIEEIINDYGKEIHLVKESLILSKDSKSHEKLQFDIENALARHFLNNLSDEVKKGYDILLDDNFYPHVPPIGYQSRLSNHLALIDSSSASYIKRAFELCASGEYSEKQIVNILYKEGFRSRKGNKVGKTSIGKILHNRFYMGDFIWGDKLYHGVHESIINADLFNKVQEILNPHKKRGYKHNFAYIGLMKCGECGYGITADIHRGHVYYRCTKPKGAQFCLQKHVREEDLNPQFESVIRRVSLDIKKLKTIKDVFRDSHKDEEEYFKQSLEVLNNKFVKLREKEGVLLDTYLEGSISKEAYNTKSLQITEEISVVSQEISKYKLADRAYIGEIETFLDFCNQAPTLFKSSRPELKRELLRFVVSNMILRDKKVEFTLKTPFDIVAKYSENEDGQGW